MIDAETLRSKLAEILFLIDNSASDTMKKEWEGAREGNSVLIYYSKRAQELIDSGIFGDVWVEACDAVSWAMKNGPVDMATRYTAERPPFPATAATTSCGMLNPRKGWICNMGNGHSGSHKTFIGGETYDWKMEY